MEVAESVTSLSVMPVKDEQAPHDYVNAIEQRLSLLARDELALVVANHIRSCGHWDSCCICSRARERLKRSRERKRLQKKLRFRGVLKSVLPLLELHRRAAEKTYRPGGLGYEAARSSCNNAQLECLCRARTE